MTILEVSCKALGNSDISGLGVLDSPCQENDHGTPPFGEMHSVPGTVVDAQFGDTLPHSLHISGISGGQALDSDLDARSCAKIAQSIKPLCEHLSLAPFNHERV